MIDSDPFFRLLCHRQGYLSSYRPTGMVSLPPVGLLVAAGLVVAATAAGIGVLGW